MKLSSFPIHESVYTAMIRSCTVNNKNKEALDLYYDMQKCNIIPKLRTLLPLLIGFSNIGDEKTCFHLFYELIDLYKLIPTEKEYFCMLKVTVLCNDNRFYTILNLLMEDVLVPSKCIWEIVTEWFVKCENKRYVRTCCPLIIRFIYHCFSCHSWLAFILFSFYCFEV